MNSPAKSSKENPTKSLMQNRRGIATIAYHGTTEALSAKGGTKTEER